MQCAAMSAPQLRSAPRGRATIGFVPIESREAASRRPSPSGCRLAKAPKPVAPVDSTAVRRRSTTAAADVSETPASAYVLRLTARVYEAWRSGGFGETELCRRRAPFRQTLLREQLAVKLRPSRRAFADEADEGLADLDAVIVHDGVEQVRERRRLPTGILGFQPQPGKAHRLAFGEQVVDPLARRMDFDPVADTRRDERPPPRIFLDSELEPLGSFHHLDELVLVQREADVIDPGQLPLSGLYDDIDGPAFELGQPEAEAEPLELLPWHSGLKMRLLVADPPVPRHEVKTELCDVAGLHVAHLARHQVVVEELHGIYARAWCCCTTCGSARTGPRC